MVLLTHNQAPEVLKPGEEPFDVPSAFITAWQKSKLWPGAAGGGFAVQDSEDLQVADVTRGVDEQGKISWPLWILSTENTGAI